MRELSDKLMNRLHSIARNSEDHGGAYPGNLWETAYKQHRQLLDMGLVELYRPHNPAHRLRVVITDKGRALLAARGESHE